MEPSFFPHMGAHIGFIWVSCRLLAGASQVFVLTKSYCSVEQHILGFDFNIACKAKTCIETI